MKVYYYEDINHYMKEVKAFDNESAIKQADNFWNLYSKNPEVDFAILYSPELETIKEYNK